MNRCNKYILHSTIVFVNFLIKNKVLILNKGNFFPEMRPVLAFRFLQEREEEKKKK